MRICGAGQFLKNLRLKSQLLQKDIAKISDISHFQVSSWERNVYTIPLRLLVKIAETCGLSRSTIYSYIDQGVLIIKPSLPVRFEKISDIMHHFSPYKSDIGWITVTNCSKNDVTKIETRLKIRVVSNSRGKRITSKGLYNYLTTFFQYSKVPKIEIPLTSDVKHWYEQGFDLRRAIIIPCLQSDGTTKQKQDISLTFYGLGQLLHNYFVDAMYYEYNELPTAYFVVKSDNSCLYTAFNQKSVTEIFEEIIKLAGNTKTSPKIGQTVEDYLKEPQPHLNYLINASEMEQNIALRIWASTEGFISINRSKGWIYPALGIACAHPDIATQLQQIAQQFNINFTKKRSKNSWSGIKVLLALTISSCIAFLKLGGFIKGVKISLKSKYHKGMNKDVLLLGILEFIKRERTKDFYRNLPLKKVHNKINKIIGNKEYKSADHYIEYFS